MRRPVQQQARSRAAIVALQPPVKGLILSSPPGFTDPMGAEVLENWIPTQRGVRVRGGMQEAASVGSDPVTSLFTYLSTGQERLFAATATDVYNVSGLDPEATLVPVIAGQSAGYYSAQQIGTAGGEYLVIVNGEDYPWIYDGAEWNPITSVAVSDLDYDGLTADFTVGETVTGGTSGASATILAIIPATATTGTLKLGTITSGPFQNDEAITSAGGAAVANGASAAASVGSVTITGVTTTTLAHVWLYRSRLFFVEADTLTAWYLPVDSIGGAASDLSLAGIFQRGGSLLFGATWSLDSGDGLDDKCVFVSTEGEVAIYSGSDPSSASDWRLEGRYDVAKPLGQNGTMQAGGDLLIATVDGIVPLSQIINKDPAALSLSAVTRPIERLWVFEANNTTSPVELLKWPERSLGVVTLPDSDKVLTVNVQTGAWAVQTGWVATCAETFLGKAYIGCGNGSVCAIDEGGTDNGEPFTSRLCMAFSDLGRATEYKRAQMVRCSFFSPSDVTHKVGMALDYSATFDAAPSATDVNASGDYLVWDVGDWDDGLWWSDAIEEQSQGVVAPWRSVTGAGYALAPTVQITSGQSTKLNVELVRVEIAFEAGGSVV